MYVYIYILLADYCTDHSTENNLITMLRPKFLLWHREKRHVGMWMHINTHTLIFVITTFINANI